MIDFNGDSCYFVVSESKYGLSEIVPKYVTNKNFTFCVQCNQIGIIWLKEKYPRRWISYEE